MPGVRIRDYEPSDVDDLYEVCARTGDSGADATDLISVPRLLGEVFVGPYLALEPNLALVADDGRRAAGYALAALDTSAFERRMDTEWWPDVRRRNDRDQVPPAPTGNAMSDELLAMIDDPLLVHHPELPGFPSHLHIDLLEHVRGDGVGTRMLTELFARLQDAGSVGVHLGVAASNERAQRFYARLGFDHLQRRGEEIFMGLSWQT